MTIVIRLDTGSVPPADRFGWWCEMTARDLIPTRISSTQAADFRAAVSHVSLGQVGISVLELPELRSVRTPRLIRRSDPGQWVLALVTSGSMGIEQNGIGSRLERDGMLLYDTSRPFDSAVLAGRASLVILPVPRELPVPESALRALTAHPLPTRSGTAALLAHFLGTLAAHAGSLENGHVQRLGSATLDIVTACLAAQVEATGRLPPATLAACLLPQIKAYILRHLDDQRLGLAGVAAAHHISLRYLHRLFEQEELSVARFIRNQRLRRCRADLADPLLATRSVAEIGARWGYPDPATFNRAFKQAYGQPPGEYRQALRSR
jgi:AraC-like DNA-binding protein